MKILSSLWVLFFSLSAGAQGYSQSAEPKSADGPMGVSIGVGYNAANTIEMKDVPFILAQDGKVDVTYETQGAPLLVLGFDRTAKYSYTLGLNASYEFDRKITSMNNSQGFRTYLDPQETPTLALLAVNANVGFRFSAISVFAGANYLSPQMRATKDTNFSIVGKVGAQAGIGATSSSGLIFELMYKEQNLAFKTKDLELPGKMSGLFVQTRYLF